jgi:outer membrane protein assembly factor BamB
MTDTRTRWRFETDGAVYSSPTVVGGTVYVGSDDSGLYTLDAETGAVEWGVRTGGQVRSSPAVSGSRVFFGSDDCSVYALDREDGDPEWGVKTGNEVGSSPTVADGTVYVGSKDHSLRALDTETGHTEWEVDTESWVSSSPTVADGTVFVGSWDDNVYAVDAESGEIIWTVETSDTVSSSPTVAGSTVFVGSFDGGLYALDADTGETEWRLSTGDKVISSPTVAGGTVFVGGWDEIIYAVDAETGDVEWTVETKDGVGSSPTVAEGIVFVGCRDNRVYAIDADTGAVEWTVETDGVVGSSPTVANGTVFVGSDDGYLYALDAGIGGASEGSRVVLGTLGHHDERAAATGTVNPAAFGVEITDTTAPVERGKELGVAVSVTNTGVNEATQAVELAGGDLGSEVSIVTLDGGATTTAVLSLDAGVAPGEYTVTAATDNDTDSETVAVLEPATFEVSGVDADAPGEDGRVEVRIEVTNTGGARASQPVDIDIEGVDTTTREPTLDGGTSEVLSLSLPAAALAEGDCTVSVSTADDSHTTSVPLSDAAASGTETTPTTESVGASDTVHGGTGGPAQAAAVPETAGVAERSLTDADIEREALVGRTPGADIYRATAAVDGDRVTLALTEPRVLDADDPAAVDAVFEAVDAWVDIDDHDHVLGVTGRGRDPVPWIATAYVDAHLGDRAGDLDEQALAVGIAVADALGYAHEHGVTHLGLTPSNVRLRGADGPTATPLVTDWGLSAVLTAHTGWLGDVAYAAPEEFGDGPTGTHTDIYRLGAVLYEACTGRPPFEGTPAEVLGQTLDDDPAPPSAHADVPAGLDDVLLTALARDPTERSDADTLHEALQRLARRR